MNCMHQINTIHVFIVGSENALHGEDAADDGSTGSVPGAPAAGAGAGVGPLPISAKSRVLASLPLLHTAEKLGSGNRRST